MGLFNTIRYIVGHPLNEGARWAALGRFAKWQIRSRLRAGPHIVPWVGEARLAVTRGMTGATGNIYAGLHELAEMAFLLHILRPGDLFVDAGANVGTYTILAAKCAGADVVAVEPAVDASRTIEANVKLNDVGNRVEVHRVALGARRGTVAFTTSFDTVNHVATDRDRGVNRVEVEMAPLDELLRGRIPAAIKIDVEGFETEVVAGARETLQRPGLLAVIMELNGAGARYGYNDSDLHRIMLSVGFQAMAYEPFGRTLRPESTHGATGNTIYVADEAAIAERVRTSRRFRVLDREI